MLFLILLNFSFLLEFTSTSSNNKHKLN
jgi:hypothetical protein